jgi:hypothetical protein
VENKMGGFMIWSITFENDDFRGKFERLFQITRRAIIFDENSESYNFEAWKYLYQPNTVIYNMGFRGYIEVDEFVDSFIKTGEIKIQKIYQLCVNDLTGWYDAIKKKNV